MSLKSKFCPRCGKETEHLINALCEDCFREKTPVGEIPDQLALQLCPRCGSYKKGMQWQKTYNLASTIKTLLRKEMEMKGQGTVNMKLDPEMKSATVKTRWFIDEKQQNPTETHNEIMINIQKRLCDSCFRKFSGYYVATVQLRGDADSIAQATSRIMGIENHGELWFISKIEEVKGGIDIQLGSKDMAYEIERMFKGKDIKKSYSLVTRRDGQDLYRTTILIRL